METLARMSFGRWFTSDKQYRILLFGADTSGKTTILYQLKLGRDVQTIPTIGFNVETITYPKGFKGSKFNMWDFGGCDKLAPMMRHYISKESIVFFVHDCANQESLDLSIKLLHEHTHQMIYAGAKYLWVLLNKQDMIPETERAVVVSDLRGRFERELAKHSGNIAWRIMTQPGLSGRTGDQLHTVLDDVRQTLRQAQSSKNNVSQPAAEESLRNKPSDSELNHRALIQSAQIADTTEFWNSFITGDLLVWDHISHLQAGFIILLDSLSRGDGIFDAADIFISHLTRLRESKPERFRNTAHRTLTIFWLFQLYLAALNFQLDNSQTAFPSKDQFKDVLLSAPALMDTKLWASYYSKDHLFNPAARDNWRLPDLRPLPAAGTSSTRHPQTPPDSSPDPDRLLRFAFHVIQQSLTQGKRRGSVIKPALLSLQTSTVRARARGVPIPPYSETQAYFWIQLVHAALLVLSTQPAISSQLSISKLDFQSFRTLVAIDARAWRGYYSEEAWESVHARMRFQVPDLRPLPNVLQAPSADAVRGARAKALEVAALHVREAAAMPPGEILDLFAALVVEDAEEVPEPVTAVITNHAHLLLYLYVHLVAAPIYKEGLSTQGSAVILALTLPGRDSYTEKSFWVHQVLATCSAPELSEAKGKRYSSFKEYVKAWPYLAYEDLPFLYYSPELWHSEEARTAFIPPDRKPLPGFVDTAT
ncbi:ADP-ribosylation factor family-domain-containing protein [Whalleya microplaca]|nr:ADP-ribosylation factor family-domain-containing protein [Whalleya microplaca]